jgi:hypothetical protein
MTSYSGEYIEYSADIPIIISSFTLATQTPYVFNNALFGTSLDSISGASVDSILGPDEIIVVASNNAYTWELVKVCSNLTPLWQVSNGRITVSLDNTTAYTSYRFVATKLAYQNFFTVSTTTDHPGVLCTELLATTPSGETITIFPEGVTVPPPGSDPVTSTALVFIVVRNYPYVQGQAYRLYNGPITTTLGLAPPEPTVTPSPTPGPSPTPEPTPPPTPCPTYPCLFTPCPYVSPCPYATPAPNNTGTILLIIALVLLLLVIIGVSVYFYIRSRPKRA